MNATETSSAGNALRRSHRIEFVAVALFVVVNLAAPLIVGERYPFTVSPMFRDQPCQYCTYRLFDENENELDPEPFGLHLVYDGNPPGLGMGIEASPTMHAFGEVPDLQDVARHVIVRARSNERVPQSTRPGKIRICQFVTCCDGTCPQTNMREETVTLFLPVQETE